MTPAKSNAGRFFEDFHVGEVIRHSGPRTINSCAFGCVHAAPWSCWLARQRQQAAGRRRPVFRCDLLFREHAAMSKELLDPRNALARGAYVATLPAKRATLRSQAIVGRENDRSAAEHGGAAGIVITKDGPTDGTMAHIVSQLERGFL
jgi:hypothetical protein